MTGISVRARVFRAGIAAVVVALLIAFLVLGGPPDDTLLWDSVFDLGHVVLFMGMTGLCVAIAQWLLPMSTGARLAMAFSVTLLIGGLTEINQLGDPTRNASFGDFVRDGAGATIFALLWLSRGTGSVGGFGRTLQVAACCIALLMTTPLILTASIYAERDSAFPVLVRLDGSRWESSLLDFKFATMKGRSAPGLTDAGNATGLTPIVFRPAVFAGFALNEPYPDWRGFKQLVFTVLSQEDEPLTLRLRIHDRRHNNETDDRFTTLIEVRRGIQVVTVPLDAVKMAPRGREMDLSQIKGVGIYAFRLDRVAEAYLGELRLE